MHLTIIIFNRHIVVPFEANRPSRDLLVSSFQLNWSIEMWIQSIEKNFLLSLWCSTFADEISVCLQFAKGDKVIKKFRLMANFFANRLWIINSTFCLFIMFDFNGHLNIRTLDLSNNFPYFDLFYWRSFLMWKFLIFRPSDLSIVFSSHNC